jgi:unspecific monooxygenase
MATIDVLSVLGFDPFSPAYRDDPYAHYRRLADSGGPLQRTGAGLWVTASYDLCVQALRSPAFGHPDDGAAWRSQTARRRSFLILNPPDHTRLRRLVSKAFSARLIERLRPRITELVDGLLDGLTGEADLISALAYPLPVTLISELLGVPPEDQERFKGWSDALARGLDPDFLLPEAELAERARARTEFDGYFRGLIAERRAVPRQDLLSDLVVVSDGGDMLSEDEVAATCVLLLVAGHETTVNLIGNGALSLLRNPSQLAWFRARPQDRPAAVEELLRYDAPVQFTVRTALADTELAGMAIRQGEIILLLTAAANRDPAAYPDPEMLDLARPPKPHLAFGHGIHFCLGAPLARLEGQVALSRLFEREVTPRPGALVYRDNIVLRGLAELPVAIGA